MTTNDNERLALHPEFLVTYWFLEDMINRLGVEPVRRGRYLGFIDWRGEFVRLWEGFYFSEGTNALRQVKGFADRINWHRINLEFLEPHIIAAQSASSDNSLRRHSAGLSKAARSGWQETR